MSSQYNNNNSAPASGSSRYGFAPSGVAPTASPFSASELTSMFSSSKQSALGAPPQQQQHQQQRFQLEHHPVFSNASIAVPTAATTLAERTSAASAALASGSSCVVPSAGSVAVVAGGAGIGGAGGSSSSVAVAASSSSSSSKYSAVVPRNFMSFKSRNQSQKPQQQPQQQQQAMMTTIQNQPPFASTANQQQQEDDESPPKSFTALSDRFSREASSHLFQQQQEQYASMPHSSPMHPKSNNRVGAYVQQQGWQQQQQQQQLYHRSSSSNNSVSVPSSSSIAGGGAGGMFSMRDRMKNAAWLSCVRDAAKQSAVDAKRGDPHAQLRPRVVEQFSALVQNLQIKQRTALLRKRSLVDYERALKDVANDEGAQKALELWNVLDETANTVNLKLQQIRAKFDQHASNENSKSGDDDADGGGVGGGWRRPGAGASSGPASSSVIATLRRGGDITPQQAVALLKQSNEWSGTLMPFQEDSLAFFLNLGARGAHPLLADQMGLGKTCQSIALLVASRELYRATSSLTTAASSSSSASTALNRHSNQRGGRGRGRGGGGGRGGGSATCLIPPSIIVAPLSTSSSWEHELKTFAPGLRVGVLGTTGDRASLFREFFDEAPDGSPRRKSAPKRRGRYDDDDNDDESDDDDEDESSSSSDDEDDDSDGDSSSEDEYDDDDTSSGESTSSSTRRRRKKRQPIQLRQRGGGKNSKRAGGGAASSARGRGGGGGKKPAASSPFGFDVLVLPHHFFSGNFPLVKKYLPKLARTKWFFCIVDEAHRIKNESAKMTMALQQFKHVSHRLVLTGTPLQNRIDELWTLLSFLLPDVFAKAESASLLKIIQELHQTELPSAAAKKKQQQKNPTSTTASNEERAKALREERQYLLCRKIHDVLLPLMIRREKEDVMRELPKLIDWSVVCPSAALQRYEAALFHDNKKKSVAYEAAALAAEDRRKVGKKQQQRTKSSSAEDDDDGDNDGDDVGAGGGIEELSVFHERRISLHPFLLRKKAAVSEMLWNVDIQHHLFLGSGKFLILDMFLQFIHAVNQRLYSCSASAKKEERHKVLIFSQYTQLLDLVETHCGWCRGWPYLRLDGAITGGDRSGLLDTFKNDDEQFIFLLSKGAGGVGLNLQSSDTVVLLDVDYTPAQDAQAIARAHRVGQKKDVLVLRLISDFGAEQDIIAIAEGKKELEQRLIRAGKFDTKTGDDDRDDALRQLVFNNKKKNNTDGAAAAPAANEEEGQEYNDDDAGGDNDAYEAPSSNDPMHIQRLCRFPIPQVAATGAIARSENLIKEANKPVKSGDDGCDGEAIIDVDNNSSNGDSAAPPLSSSAEAHPPPELVASVKKSLASEILRFFPRSAKEKEVLRQMIDREALLDAAAEALAPVADPVPPPCLVVPDGAQFKNNVMLPAPRKLPHEEELGPRANRLAAERLIEERKRRVEEGDEEEEEWDEFDD